MTQTRHGTTAHEIQMPCGDDADTQQQHDLDMVSQGPHESEAHDNTERFLWRCGHGTLTAPQLLALKAAGELLTPAEWEQVALLAHPHRMGSLVFKHASQAELLTVMLEAVRDSLKVAYCSAIVVNRTLQIELATILAAFAARQIEAVPLKGVMLAARYYPELALRPSSDIDLLLMPDQVTASAQALATLGYRPHAGSESQTGKHALRFLELQFTKPQGPTIELHTTLTRAPSYRKSLPLPAVWSRTHLHQVGDRMVRCLAVRDELHYLCLHYAVHRRDPRWFWLVDIVQLVDALPATWSWSEFVCETLACGLATPVATALQDTTDRFGSGVPPYVLDALWTESTSAKERAAWKQAHASFSSPGRVSGHLLMLHGARAKLEFAREIVRVGSLSMLRRVRRARRARR